MVAYFDRSRSKWYRAVVDFYIELSSNTDSYILWLIDYGFPTRVLGSTIYKLEKRFYTPESFGNVFKVGVSNVLPASEDYDYLNERPVVEIVDKWDGSTVSKLQKIFEASSGIEFREKVRYKDQRFGELKIHTSTGKILDLCKVLAKSPNAIQVGDVDEFLLKLKNLQTINVERYEDNNRQCVKSPEQKMAVEPKRNSVWMSSQSKRMSRRSSESASTVSSITTTTTATATTISDDPNEMPLLISSSYETESEMSNDERRSMPNTLNGQDTTSYKPPSNESKKISKILERLNQRKMTKSSDVQSVSSSSNSDRNDQQNGPKVVFMPACYDQVLGQEERAKKTTSPPKSTSSLSSTSSSLSDISAKKPKGMSRLDKILALNKAAVTKKNEPKMTSANTTTTTTTTTTNDYSKSANEFSSEGATSRIKKVQLATVTELDAHAPIKDRQNIKHRDDDERLV